MKKAVILCTCILCCCLGAGLLSSGGFFFGTDAPARNTMRAAASGALASRGMETIRPAARVPLDTGDDERLIARAEEVLAALAEEDYPALGRLVHPARGVTFTPYSTVDPEKDLCFLPAQVAAAGRNKTVYLWGIPVGEGAIRLTMPEYFRQYVYNADYRSAPERGVDETLASGNARENVEEVFPQERYVEYHFPGLRPENQQMDWCSLKLVFDAYEEEWYLVGLIHSEWVN